MGDSFSLLDELERDLATLETPTLDSKYRQLAATAAGDEVATAIARLPAASDAEDLERGLRAALDRGARTGAIVINVEYDLRQQWAVWFFVCHEYSTPEEGDDGWAADYAEELRGPVLDEFASVHHAHGAFDDSPRFAVSLYLVARLCVALRDLARVAPHPALGITVGYHQQEPIWRLREPDLR